LDSATGLRASHFSDLREHALHPLRSRVDVDSCLLHLLRWQVEIRKHLRSAKNRRERISQIVGDRGSQPSDGRNLAALNLLGARGLNRSRHVVEGVREHAELVIGIFGDARGVVFAADLLRCHDHGADRTHDAPCQQKAELKAYAHRDQPCDRHVPLQGEDVRFDSRKGPHRPELGEDLSFTVLEESRTHRELLGLRNHVAGSLGAER